MRLEHLKISPLMWLVATMVAAVTMVAAASTYVYTRNEGVHLEKRIDRVDSEVSRRLERIEDKVDRLISNSSGK